MSFFIRVWVQGTDIPFINSRDHQITSDMTDISPAIVIDAEVDGSYMDAGEVREALTINNNVISITDRTIISQSTSTRPN